MASVQVQQLWAGATSRYESALTQVQHAIQLAESEQAKQTMVSLPHAYLCNPCLRNVWCYTCRLCTTSRVNNITLQRLDCACNRQIMTLVGCGSCASSIGGICLVVCTHCVDCIVESHVHDHLLRYSLYERNMNLRHIKGAMIILVVCLLQLHAAIAYIKLQQQRVQDMGIRREFQDMLGTFALQFEQMPLNVQLRQCRA